MASLLKGSAISQYYFKARTLERYTVKYSQTMTKAQCL